MAKFVSTTVFLWGSAWLDVGPRSPRNHDGKWLLYPSSLYRL